MFIVFVVVLFVIFGGIHHSLKKNRQHIIDNDQWDYYQSLNQQQQTHFINEQIRMMNEMQQQQFMQQAEMARLMATGMEFGGFNPDINLNPGQQMQQQMMNQMNNSGGPGMF